MQLKIKSSIPFLQVILKAVLLNILAWILFLLIIILFYFAWLREYQMNWGATDEEISRYMPGDELVDNPDFNATRVVEINGTPEQIWPWIVQIGYSKGGFYGFDKLDNGGNPSANRIIPEYQSLKVGDSIAAGEYKGKLFYFMEVVEMNPPESMLWVFIETPWKGGTWSWGLYKVDEKRTRLVSRLRKDFEIDSYESIVPRSLIDACEILMMRTTLLGIKYRVENIGAI